MGLGKNTRRNDLKALSLKIKTKDLPKPVFVVSQRENDKWVELAETTDTVFGNVIGIEPKEVPYQGKVIKSVNLTLQDKEELYFVTVPWTILGRSLLNSLLALKDFSNVEIGLYQSKPKSEGGKTYPSVAVRQNGEIVRWRYTLAELPEVKVVEFRGEKMRDYLALDKFLSDQVTELNKLIKQKAPVSPNPAVVPPSESNDEDVPF